MLNDDAALPLDQTIIAVRAANEGIPIAAIGRVLAAPFELVSDTLKVALGSGRIAAIPKPDWPPSQAWDSHLPTIPRSANNDDVEFAVGKVFKLTRLEAGFLMVLLRCDSADKEKLHAVVEDQRQTRHLRPDSSDATDPKMVDVMICKLRKKLRDRCPELTVKTQWGRGYYIEKTIKQKIYEVLEESRD